MALVIEDGSGKSDATSFTTGAQAVAYGTLRGVSMPPEAEMEPHLVLAADYLLRYESRLQGYRSTAEQRLPFPRGSVYLHSVAQPADEIPAPVVEAQILLAIESFKGVELRPRGEGREVLMEEIGPLKQQFAETGSGASGPVFHNVEDVLRPLFRGHSGMEVGRA